MPHRRRLARHRGPSLAHWSLASGNPFDCLAFIPLFRFLSAPFSCFRPLVFGPGLFASPSAVRRACSRTSVATPSFVASLPLHSNLSRSATRGEQFERTLRRLRSRRPFVRCPVRRCAVEFRKFLGARRMVREMSCRLGRDGRTGCRSLGSFDSGPKPRTRTTLNHPISRARSASRKQDGCLRRPTQPHTDTLYPPSTAHRPLAPLPLAQLGVQLKHVCDHPAHPGTCLGQDCRPQV